MHPACLIIIFSLFFAATFADIWKKDHFYGGVYFFLYMYTIFTQIGYAYFPELSLQMKAYFGPQLFYRYYLFVFLSFIAFYLVFLSFRPWFAGNGRYAVVQHQSVLKRLFFYLFIVSHLVFMLSYFVRNFELLTYANASDQDFLSEQGALYFLFSLGFKFMVFINFILYSLYRLRNAMTCTISRTMIFILLLAEMCLFLFISAKIGSRIDIIALAAAVCIFEIKLSFNTTKMIKLGLFAVLVLSIILFIEFLRGGFQSESGLTEKILFKDYYPPSHILIAAIEYQFISPLEVFRSNLSNALFKLNYPYLQATVADLFNPGVSTRSASYAFYIFTEGYMALGWPGFIYNGIIVFMGLSLWRWLASSRNYYYNSFALGVISTQMINIVRGQSSYFIKDIYLFFLPAIFLFYLASGMRPRLPHFNKLF